MATTFHYLGGTWCKELSVPWHVVVLKQLFHQVCSFVCGNHECVPMIFLICFSLSDKEQPSLPSQPTHHLFLFSPQHQMSTPIQVTTLHIHNLLHINNNSYAHLQIKQICQTLQTLSTITNNANNSSFPPLFIFFLC